MKTLEENLAENIQRNKLDTITVFLTEIKHLLHELVRKQDGERHSCYLCKENNKIEIKEKS